MHLGVTVSSCVHITVCLRLTYENWIFMPGKDDLGLDSSADSSIESHCIMCRNTFHEQFSRKTNTRHIMNIKATKSNKQ